MEHKQKLLSKLPKVDQTLQDQRLFAFFEDTSRDLIVESVREVIAEEPGRVIMETEIGTQALLPQPGGELLPRIC